MTVFIPLKANNKVKPHAKCGPNSAPPAAASLRALASELQAASEP